MYKTILTVLFSGVMASTALAGGEVTEADAIAWINQLKGKWKTTMTVGDKVYKGTFALRKVKGTASGIARFTDNDGETTSNGAEIGGWQSDRKVCQINGYNSTGDWYQLEYTKLSANGGEGTITGVANGLSYTDAKFTIKVDKNNNNHIVWDLAGKTNDGQPLKMSSDWTRDKAP